MPRSTATFSISLPPKMAAELERVRRSEHRTRSELVREALRTYIRQVDLRDLKTRLAALPEEAAAADESEAVERGRAKLLRRKPRAAKRRSQELRRRDRRPGA
jgi:CopG family transcriptional regulator / antitoxin EndoAI